MLSCAEDEPDYDLQVLFALMQGSFSSEAQASESDAFFNVSLKMQPIWVNQGYWLYVEQAMAGREDEPYRQRIYHLYRNNEGNIISDVYSIPYEEFFVGAWEDPSLFDHISPPELTLREGCSVRIGRNSSGDYYGGTRRNECKSSINNASYATSEVLIHRDGMLTWDRGFNDANEQVWGSTKGGYLFLRTGY